MPAWLTFFGAIAGTAVFFGVLYGGVMLLVEGRRTKAKPRMGVGPGEKPGTLSVWMNWQPEVFPIQVYRIRMFHVTPDHVVKEGQFTITLEPPAKSPFIQSFEFPSDFKEIIESGGTVQKSIFTFEVRTTDEMVIQKALTLPTVRKLYHGKFAAGGLQQLKLASPDHPTVMTLDYSELVANRRRIKDLEAQAKAKAAKAPPKPATAAAAAPTTPVTTPTAS